MSRSDLADLEAFAAIARWGSLRRAAAELGVTPSALSHSHRRFEERLGVRLLNRTTRSVSLTEAGGRVLARAGPALGALREALGEARPAPAGPAGRVRINVPRLAAATLIAPALAPFRAACPGVVLEVTVEDRAVDVIAAGFDAGVRFGHLVERDMVSVAVGAPQGFAAVASPGYLRSAGAPAHPDDLRAHRTIGYRLASRAIFPWRFRRGADEATLRPQGGDVVSDPLLTVAAAEAGLGIAYTAQAFVEDGLAAGRLVRVLPDWACPAERLHVYHGDHRQVPPALRAFIDFLKAR